jgi:hypothetical protein
MKCRKAFAFECIYATVSVTNATVSMSDNYHHGKLICLERIEIGDAFTTVNQAHKTLPNKLQTQTQQTQPPSARAIYIRFNVRHEN